LAFQLLAIQTASFPELRKHGFAVEPSVVARGFHADFHFATESLWADFTHNLVDTHSLQCALNGCIC
jgi:hypothetical protein